jgi:hypothetical protein
MNVLIDEIRQCLAQPSRRVEPDRHRHRGAAEPDQSKAPETAQA